MARDFRPAYSLLDHYKELYLEKYNRSPQVNKYRDKWPAVDICEDIGLAHAKILMSYYFRTGVHGHPLSTFFNSYDLLAVEKDRQDRDKEKIKEIMRETEKRVKNGR